MSENENSDNEQAAPARTKKSTFKRFIVGLLLMLVTICLIGVVVLFLTKNNGVHLETDAHDQPEVTSHKAEPHKEEPLKTAPHKAETVHQETATHKEVAEHAEKAEAAETHVTATHSPVAEHAPAKEETHDDHAAVIPRFQTKGMEFVTAVIEPMEYELNERFWGWRLNDILPITDNVNELQKGVLEVIRRSLEELRDSISRTGVSEAFDKNLENAVTRFSFGPDKYWFPSSESEYKQGVKELKIYKEKLQRREAAFYTRTDNLIPLLTAYRNLLGSCDGDLVKHEEKKGYHVSSFRADEYLYYAKGVATALKVILEAIQVDFHDVLAARHCLEDFHHAIESCRIASEIDPWVVTEGNYSGILANHRANMAAPISHARFYLNNVITTLST